MNSQTIKIKRLHAREVLDSRGFPTVEVEMDVEGSRNHQHIHTGRAIVPSGASTGENEALELRDGDKKRFLGKGVLKAIGNIEKKIAPAITEREFARQPLLDDMLRELDGTPNKSKLGANAVLGVSMAFARASAAANGIPTFQSLAELYGTQGTTLPVPLMNILNGGQHADNRLEIQEFMIVPLNFPTFKDALRAGTEVFHHLKIILKGKGESTSVGDEGGFAPNFDDTQPHEQALTAIMQAITDAGYRPGKDIYLALDAASSEFSDRGADEIIYRFEGKRFTSKDLIATYEQWIETYPIVSIEDGLSEHDWKGWELMTQTLGSKCQLVGDDLFVTNPEFLKKGIEQKAANSILIKLNQIGTVTETLEAIKMAEQANYTSITSHRSGETEDTFIADLAVSTDCGQIKQGLPHEPIVWQNIINYSGLKSSSAIGRTLKGKRHLGVLLEPQNTFSSTKTKKKAFTNTKKPPNKSKKLASTLWGVLILLWFIVLSGTLPLEIGKPGVTQAFHLYQLLENKKNELKATEAKVEQLKEDISQFKNNPKIQEREIRNSLGYSAPGEIVFDFR